MLSIVVAFEPFEVVDVDVVGHALPDLIGGVGAGGEDVDAEEDVRCVDEVLHEGDEDGSVGHEIEVTFLVADGQLSEGGRIGRVVIRVVGSGDGGHHGC